MGAAQSRVWTLLSLLAAAFAAQACGPLNPPEYVPDSQAVTTPTNFVGGSSGGSGSGGSTSASGSTTGTTTGTAGGGGNNFNTVATQVIGPLGCANCHTTFGTYAGASANASAMYSMMSAQNMPPPSGGASAAQLQTFLAWVNAGAPQ
jgi:hypothetical protein